MQKLQFFTTCMWKKIHLAILAYLVILCVPEIPIWTVYGELQLHLVQWDLFWSVQALVKGLF